MLQIEDYVKKRNMIKFAIHLHLTFKKLIIGMYVYVFIV
jgi:hypothetical protein